ncbi:MAG: hypothetical protein GX444_17885 [Myxococcales bacterium]|nr:hypothetical protein [Myxococcales bacterium]
MSSEINTTGTNGHSNDVNAYPVSFLGWLFFFLPQIAILVFLAVCVLAILRNGGSPKLFFALVPIFIVNAISYITVRRSC